MFFPRARNPFLRTVRTSRPQRRRRKLGLEPLEDRRLLALLGVTPQFPLISYDFSGHIFYDSAAQAFSFDATPLAFKASGPAPARTVVADPATGIRDLQINIQVDNAGNLVGGTAGPDLVMIGGIDINGDSVLDATGTLLTGEISQFGWYDSATTTDKYDFRFTPTGGSLQSYFLGKDIAVTTNSEGSNFAGSFATDFSGGAKGNVGTVAPLLSSLSGYVYDDSANNDGLKQPGEAGIPGVTVTLTGTNVDGVAVNISATTDANGAYSFASLRPGTYTITETQPAGWLDGKDTIGTPGGTAGNDVLSGIALAAGVNGQNNNFGELQPASLSGYVYVDASNDGVKDAGEAAISGVTLTLSGTDDLGNAVSATATSDANGAYSFTDLRPGTYTVTETQPAGYLDGKDTIGTPGGTAGNDVLSNIVLASGVNGTDNNFGELQPASLAGFVWVDANNDGEIDINETAIAGVTVTLTGVNDLGVSITMTAVSDADGYYSFTGLRPGTYAITETQPAGYLDGKDSLGTAGGMLLNDRVVDIVLASGTSGINYNFGELLPVGSPLHAGQTATIGFWHNKNGQALIKSLNGGSTSTALGNWLAANFNNMYGANAGANNLAGKTNAQIAAFFLQLFNVKGQKLDAQVLAVAFATYVTNSSLAGGTTAGRYGFIVDGQGAGSATFNVGCNGAAVGVANNTTMSILDMLYATNARSRNGVLYDLDGNRTISSAEQVLRNMANTLYTAINETGDIA